MSGGGVHTAGLGAMGGGLGAMSGGVHTAGLGAMGGELGGVGGLSGGAHSGAFAGLSAMSSGVTGVGVAQTGNGPSSEIAQSPTAYRGSVGGGGALGTSLIPVHGVISICSATDYFTSQVYPWCYGQ